MFIVCNLELCRKINLIYLIINFKCRSVNVISIYFFVGHSPITVIVFVVGIYDVWKDMIIKPISKVLSVQWTFIFFIIEFI